ncbi:hypothetical protein BD311DRAFT_758693 [Dichomitus squalens]|uniref:F-box domain-containing protein n=1 Tax=Dichomitus squalens TaxID=114155 RepID=A0A4Q9MPW3_9APHY|nr:hypothetical protein BD311DRAFT_758693 [Dichomitus squalens]
MAMSSSQSNLYQLTDDALKSFERVGKSQIQPGQVKTLALSTLSSIQSILNAMRPINLLPPETLILIFSFVPRRNPIPTDTEGRPWPFDIPDVSIYLQLATVCKHWCNIIRGTPALWSVVSGPGAMSFLGRRTPKLWYLMRCPCGPLTVNIFEKVTPRMRLLLKNEGYRIQQLHIGHLMGTEATDAEDSVLSLLLSLPAAELEHCKITLAHTDSNYRKEPTVPLFSGHGENLRSLYLEKLWFLPANIFPKLRFLTIYRYYVFSDPVWSIEDLFKFLAGSPDLEELRLLHVWNRSPPSPAPLSAGTATVVLPRLRIFVLTLRGHASASTLQTLFPTLQLPPTCRLRLEQVKIDELHAVSPALRSLGQPFTRMHLTLTRRTRYLSDPPSQESESWDWSLILAPSQSEGFGGVWIRLEAADAAAVPSLLGPKFRKIPFLENVEELWLTSNLFSEALLRRICLPPNVRGLALTILNGGVLTRFFAPVMLVSAQLDTLCICILSADYVGAVKDALTNTGLAMGPMPKLNPIRRVAVGYAQSTPLYNIHKGGPSLRGCGAGTEISWIGRIAGRSGDDAEMDRLLNSPATIRASWPRWS